MHSKKVNIIKRIVDAVLTVLLLFIMAYQVTGEKLHEWLGAAMTLIVIGHHILNYKWYKSLFKGKYTPYRIALTATDILLLAAFAVTALNGMSMSGHAVPFMYGTINAMTARKLHLTVSYWAFTLMGLHIGLHLRTMTAKIKAPAAVKTTAAALFAAAAAWGGSLFFKGDIINYMLYKTHFAFFDYQKAKWLVVVENIAMLLCWTFVGYILTRLLQKHKNKAELLKPLIWLAAVAAAAAVLIFAMKDKNDNSTSSSWQSAPAPQAAVQISQAQTSSENSQAANGQSAANDGFFAYKL